MRGWGSETKKENKLIQEATFALKVTTSGRKAPWKVKRSSPRIVLFEDRRQEHSPVVVPQHLRLANTHNCKSRKLLPSAMALKTRPENKDTAGTCS